MLGMCGRVDGISWCGCLGDRGEIFGWRHPEQYRDCSDCLTEDMPASLLATILMHILMHRTCIASWKNVEFGRSRARCFFSSIWKLFFLWITRKLPRSFSKLSYHYLFVIILFRWRAAVIIIWKLLLLTVPNWHGDSCNLSLMIYDMIYLLLCRFVDFVILHWLLDLSLPGLCF